MSSSNDYRVTISHVSVSTNNVMSFVLKEDCSGKMPMKNTYVVRINGVEMNNLNRVDKVKIENGVWQFLVDLNPILNYITVGSNCLEVDGTARMVICTSGTMDGTYSLVCSENNLSIYTSMGLCLGSDPLNQGAAGYYCKAAPASGDNISQPTIYQNISNNNRFIIFYQDSLSRWVLKRTLSAGKTVNQILYQQKTTNPLPNGPYEVPLTGWVSVVTSSNPCGGSYPQKTIEFSTCIPFDTTKLIFVNCAGIDAVNGLYFKDSSTSAFVNFMDPTYVLVYYYDVTSGQGKWNIQQNCIPTTSVPLSNPALTGTFGATPPNPLNCQGCNAGCDISCVNATVFYTNLVSGVAPLSGCAACIPCCTWTKVCDTSPGDVPSVTPLEYFDVSKPSHVLRYFAEYYPPGSTQNANTPPPNGSTWTLYDSDLLKGIATSCHYIVGGASVPTDNAYKVNGAYKYIGQGSDIGLPNLGSVYQSIIYDGTATGTVTNIRMAFDTQTNRWTISDYSNGVPVEFYWCDYVEQAIPPFENWNPVPGKSPAPRVICSMTPSGLVWSTI